MKHAWWQEALFYQIYPRSFADGNGDGIGDFEGIVKRLDYLADLGVGAIWLSPCYPSPFLDCGYDIADYTDIAPEYGGLPAFRVFLDAAHRRGIRVLMDLVLNHTSDQHPWFQEAMDPRSPKRDWYVWREGWQGGPPNNWLSTFGGPAWSRVNGTGAYYYYHAFLREQPDLNWRNPAVREAMWDVVRFWLRLGVDGFRLDAVCTIFEDPAYPESEGTAEYEALYARILQRQSPEDVAEAAARIQAIFRHQFDQPGLHALMRELRAVVDAFPDRVLIGEHEDLAYHGNGSDELHMVFNFPLMRAQPFGPRDVLENQRTRLPAIPTGAWPCNTLGNHDVCRLVSVWGGAGRARLAVAALLTLPGTPTVYNGDELGVANLVIRDVDAIRDRFVFQAMPELHGLTADARSGELLERMGSLSRDRARTPMPWSRAANGGFCPPGVRPWLPLHPDFAAGVNVADETADAGSLLNFWKQLIALRARCRALLVGDFQPLAGETGDVLAYRRATAESQAVVALNFAGEARAVPAAVRTVVRGMGVETAPVYGALDETGGLPAGGVVIWTGGV